MEMAQPTAEIAAIAADITKQIRLLSRQRKNEQVQSTAIKGRLQSEAHRFKTYLSLELQDAARDQIPIEELHNRAEAASSTNTVNNNALSFQEHLMVALLDWFKNDYMVWVNNAPCASCGNTQTVGAGNGAPTQYELDHGAARVELYKCPSDACPLTRFPRFNDPLVLMQTRRGRCGEWANLFTLFSITMGFETRYVMDYTDHVWCEFWSDHWNRWVHVDSCEGGGSLDSPLMYEQGWGKKLDYVFAVGEYEVVDVIRRYTRNLPEVLVRRKLARETKVAEWCQDITTRLRQSLTPTHIESLKTRSLTEQKELLEPPQRALGDAEKQGRQSGNLEWRSARGEVGTTYTPTLPSLPPTTTPIISFKSTTNQPTLLGSATHNPSPQIQLTPSSPDKRGAFWYTLPKPASQTKHLITDFTFRATPTTGTGADGLALVLHSAGPSAIGDGGGGLGYQGIPSSIAVEFDMYASRDTCADPDGNHVSVQTSGGRAGNSAHHRFSRGCSSNVPLLACGRDVKVRVVWGLVEGRVDVWLDDGGVGGWGFIVSGEVDVRGVLGTGGEDEGWIVGVTAATGGLYQVHHVSDFNVYELD
ncbi:peptide-N4-(N-acetyl-beta- glucosaminyl)asparagine amidase [Rhizoclosmatium sp. JEL0117]|nr:peptide-N4-(N-acetyl-beta- glucosaminyl)asparagine amidase [Rhizoclosmatium sp. JEL0117]